MGDPPKENGSPAETEKQPKAGKLATWDATLAEQIESEKRGLAKAQREVHERLLNLAALYERQPYTPEEESP